MFGFGNKATQLGPAPLAGRRAVFADLDGVVYRGSHAIPGAVDALSSAEQQGVQLAFLTNNASRPAAQVAAQLRDIGLSNTEERQVVTSPHAAVKLLAEHLEPGGLVLVVGGAGITEVLEGAGYRVTRSADDEPDAVMQGFAKDVGWVHLAEASFALAGRDIPWIATNQDWTIPVARGIAPGNGTLVSAVHTAIGRLPIVAGKPESHMFSLGLERFGVSADETLMIGDRLDTDILGSHRAGIDGVLVLTGVDRPKQVLAAAADQRPRYIIEHLGQLAEPYPEMVVDTLGTDAWRARVGKASVRIDGITVTVEHEGEHRLNLLRAASAAVAASNKMVFTLRVPDVLHEDWLAA
ncbi:HAD-IIA family hydrolase [Pseudoclavibacter albus]|uniref:HAD-IIA family hydrolase n=1 Tax=Pseudoclavibacter albus TaxID=272241 RepID=UPI00082689FB|nr:HAD-IIA family hydrolase [Pseudoclavibacter alba]